VTAEESPRRVFLFSGHIVDAPGRPEARFPAARVEAAVDEVAAALDRWDAGPLDLALCGGAAGGDLLFAEACLEREVRLEILMPFAEQRFLRASVDPSGADWRRRFERVGRSSGVTLRSPTVLPEAFADAPFAYANQWLLERALSWGAERMHLLALWDGLPGDGAGGTADMVAAASARTDHVRVIDPSRLA